MAANRRAPTQAVDLTKDGTQYSNDVDEEIVKLYQLAVNNIPTVTGTNAVAGACTPALAAAPADKQHFMFVPVAANTGAVTFDPGQGGPKALKDSAGDALEGGDLAIGEPVICYKDATADNYRQVGMTRNQISRLVSALVGESIPLIRLADHTVDVGSPAVGEPFVELLFASGTYSKVRFKIEGISPIHSNSQTVRVTLRNAGGAIVTLNGPSSSFTATGDVGTFQGEFILDNMSATGQYQGWLEGASKGVLRARTTAPGTAADSSKADRIRVELTGTTNPNIDVGRIVLDGEPIPA